MKKYFCDATGKEMDRVFSLDIPVHIIEICEKGISSYVDNEGYATSGATNKLKLNQKSYNRVMLAAYKEYIKIKEESEIINQVIKPVKDDFISYKPFDYSNPPKIPPTIIAMYGVNPNPDMKCGLNIMKYGIKFKNKNITTNNTQIINQDNKEE
jgi:hypothetical protein